MLMIVAQDNGLLDAQESAANDRGLTTGGPSCGRPAAAGTRK